MTYPTMGVVPLENEPSVLAIKARIEDVVERFVRFQDMAFIEGLLSLDDTAAQRLMYLQRKGNLNAEAFLRCDQMTDIYKFIKRAFTWKVGMYEATFEIDSPATFKITNNRYQFRLSAADIEELEKNSGQIETEYRRRFIRPQEGDPEVAWAWRQPRLSPNRGNTMKP